MSESARWQLPSLGGPVLARQRRTAELTAIEREAWEHGHAEGREAGLAAMQQQAHAAGAELGRRVQELQGILDFMTRPLADLDLQVQRELATLAAAIARQIIRRELRTQPDEIVAVVRETVALLPVSAREVRVHLHPEDAELVRSRLAAANGDRAWSIIEDPVLSRGGCRVTSDNSTIDASLEQRIGTAIASMLGDERAAAGGLTDITTDAAAGIITGRGA
jgi:flagellar assembly protein FliH